MKHAALLLMLAAARTVAGDGCAGPASIPDFDPAGIVVPIPVAGAPGEAVGAIEVVLDLAHPWVGDLTVKLESPAGVVVTLIDRPGLADESRSRGRDMTGDGSPGLFGCGGRDIAAVFVDTAADAAEDVCSYEARPVIAGPVRPLGALADFVSRPAAGTWLLHLSDHFSYDVGTLNTVCLLITTVPACPPDLNGDGLLNFFDLGAYLALYAAGDPAADLDADGLINFFDVSAFLVAFNAGCP